MSRKMNQLIPMGLRAWCYKASEFNQLGLMIDDILYENDDVKEALRRLPQRLVDERNFRIIRAMQLDVSKKILPKEEWTKMEEDIPYLRPYIAEVIKEREEREQWNAS